jgi:hypothetical protein
VKYFIKAPQPKLWELWETRSVFLAKSFPRAVERVDQLLFSFPPFPQLGSSHNFLDTRWRVAFCWFFPRELNFPFLLLQSSLTTRETGGYSWPGTLAVTLF